MTFAPTLPATATVALTQAGAYADTQVAAEAATRSAADVALDARLDALEAPQGVTTPEAYGAKGDCKIIVDAAITVSQSVLTSASGPFVSGDVGKTIMVRGAGLNVDGNCLAATILSFQSATQVTLSTTAAVSVSNAVATWGTDDTAAFKAAIAALVTTGIANGSYFGRLSLSAKEYMIAGAPTLGGATAGNAQIPLPVVVTTGKKFVLDIRGPGDGSGLYHWNQTVPQSAGAVLRSSLLGRTADGTYSLPSVIGGPTSLPLDAGTPGFSNMLVRIDGVTVIMPRNPSYLGVDLNLCAQANIGTLAVIGDGVPAGNGLAPTNSNGIGLRMPKYGNNDNTNVFAYSCEGVYYGISISDHFTAQRLALIYCNTAIFVPAPRSGPEHGSFIGYASIEACTTGIFAAAAGGGKYPIFVARMDCEVSGGGVTIDDSGSVLYGELHYAHNTSTPPSRTGATNLRIIDDNRSRGAFTAPAVPATTAALAESALPFRDALVTITAGSSTCAVAVDGQTLGTLAANGVASFPVPTGKTITLTYTNAPTWKWTLL